MGYSGDKKLDSRGGRMHAMGRSASGREGTSEPAPFNLSGLLAGAAVALLIAAMAWAILGVLVELALRSVGL